MIMCIVWMLLMDTNSGTIALEQMFFRLRFLVVVVSMLGQLIITFIVYIPLQEQRFGILALGVQFILLLHLMMAKSM